VASPTVRRALPARGDPDALMGYSPGDVILLAHLVQAEAGNQPFLGMVAVAAVVVNRLHTPGFPKTIPGVIEEPGQFESVANGTIAMAPGPLALLAAKAALAGWDPTHGAIYFYNPALTDNHWMRRLPVTTRIAAQVFCR
jgi:N-acetylmuramoyl-L-alanine amidase